MEVRPQSLRLTPPASTRSATARTRAKSPPMTEADRPNFVSLAKATASSSSAKAITGRIGPKVSSRMMSMS